MVSGMGREGTESHGVRVMFTVCHAFIEVVFAVVVSLYVTTRMCWFGVCWGHDNDVPWTVMCTTGFDNSTCLLLHVTGR